MYVNIYLCLNHQSQTLGDKKTIFIILKQFHLYHHLGI
jgi:hypothetical protein